MLKIQLSQFSRDQEKSVTDLFTEVFAESEGEAEGEAIGSLVSKLINTTAQDQLFGFIAQSDRSDDNRLLGSIFFSSLFLCKSSLPAHRTAFILSPVAVATLEQGNGIGQQLIRFGIEHLKSRGVGLIFTYGDPGFYSKVGFSPISESLVEAPLNLSYPQGWLAQSVDGQDIEAISGATRCVAALNDQKYW